MNQSFGNPIQEQKDLLAGKSFVSLDKKVLVVSGEDRLTWLNDIFSQKLDELEPQKSVEALWLDVQGRILRDIHIVDDGDQTYLITFAQDFEVFVSALTRMIFRAKVVLNPKEYLIVATFKAPVKDAVISWKDPWPGVSQGGYRYGIQPEITWEYFESLVLVEPELLKAGALALDALRVAAQRPQGPSEIDEKSLPHEYDWLATAVHLNKGCYRGQESVAKVHNLGAPPRRLVFLHLDGSGHILPEDGDEVLDTDVIGKITSAAQHFEMGPIALALVKRNFTGNEVTVRLTSGEVVSATVTDIVPTSAGGVVDLGDFRAKKN